MDVLPRLVAVYGAAAATLAADWYEDFREQADIDSRFRAITAELPDVGRTDALTRWGISPLFKAEPDFASALTLVSGGLQRIVANAGRQTITQSSIDDPAAEGWQRVGSGKDCEFCAMLIGRGAVYRESTATFASHDHCSCSAAPAFSGQPRPVKAFTPSQRGTNPLDQERARQWMRDNPQRG